MGRPGTGGHTSGVRPSSPALCAYEGSFAIRCVRSSRGRRAESPINRKEHQFDAIVNAELVIDVREMVLHSVFADVERGCDIFIGLAVYQSPNNLHLPACQTQACKLL